MEEVEKVSKEKVSKVDKFSKEQILKAEKFMDMKDLLNVILEDEKLYTILEVEKIIEELK